MGTIGSFREIHYTLAYQVMKSFWIVVINNTHIGMYIFKLPELASYVQLQTNNMNRSIGNLGIIFSNLPWYTKLLTICIYTTVMHMYVTTLSRTD